MMPEQTTPPKPLTVTKTQKGNVTILKLAGDLDAGNLATARKALAEAVGTGKSRVLFDLENVTYIDSSGLGFFIGTLKKIKEMGGDLKLFKLNAYMLGIFRLIHLDYVLDIHEDMEKALASFETGKSAARQ